MNLVGPVFTRCRRCRATAYLPRAFCSVCGGDVLDVEAFSGAGTARAVTVVHRAPSVELQALAPYAICLVDTDEGPRLMARCESNLKIGDRVSLAMRGFATAHVPYATTIP